MNNTPLDASSKSFHPSEILYQMRNKEDYEDFQMKQQYKMAKVTLDEAFAIWQKEQYVRRKRFINQNGLEVALEKGYNVPFWQWWLNRLNTNNTVE